MALANSVSFLFFFFLCPSFPSGCWFMWWDILFYLDKKFWFYQKRRKRESRCLLALLSCVFKSQGKRYHILDYVFFLIIMLYRLRWYTGVAVLLVHFHNAYIFLWFILCLSVYLASRVGGCARRKVACVSVGWNRVIGGMKWKSVCSSGVIWNSSSFGSGIGIVQKKTGATQKHKIKREREGTRRGGDGREMWAAVWQSRVSHALCCGSRMEFDLVILGLVSNFP